MLAINGSLAHISMFFFLFALTLCVEDSFNKFLSIYWESAYRWRTPCKFLW